MFNVILLSLCNMINDVTVFLVLVILCAGAVTGTNKAKAVNHVATLK